MNTKNDVQPLRRKNIVHVATPASGKPAHEADPELLEQYDNFYQTTKSLLILFQIMGIMPIERAGKGKTTFRYKKYTNININITYSSYFRWLSSTSIYAYFIFGAETIFVTIVFKERLNLILQRGKRFDEYIYGVIFLSILIPHFFLPVAAWTNGSEVAKFKNMWTRFQVR